MRGIGALAGLFLWLFATFTSYGDDGPKSKSDPVTEKLVERLIDKNASLLEKTAAVNGITKRGPRGAAAVKPLRSELEALVKSRTKEGYSHLTWIEYGRSVCWALAAIGPDAAESVDVLIDVLEKNRGYIYETLAGTETANDPTLRCVAAEALGKIVSGSKNEKLREKTAIALEAAADGDIDDKVRELAGQSLKLIRDHGDNQPKSDSSRNQPSRRSGSPAPFIGLRPTLQPPKSTAPSPAGQPSLSVEQLYGEQGLYSPSAIKWMYGPFGTPYQPQTPVPGYEYIEYQRRSLDAMYGPGGMFGPERIKSMYGRLP